MHKLIHIISFSIIIFLFSCDNKYKTFDSFNVTVNNNKAFAVDTVVKDSIFNFSFSRIKKANERGLDATFTITPNHQAKDLYIIASGNVRTNYAHSNSNITIVAASRKGEVLQWRVIPLRYFYTDCNKWCYFKDSIFLKGNVDSKFYYTISAFAMLGNSERENFDIDTLHVQLKEEF